MSLKVEVHAAFWGRLALTLAKTGFEMDVGLEVLSQLEELKSLFADKWDQLPTDEDGRRWLNGELSSVDAWFAVAGREKNGTITIWTIKVRSK